MAASGVRQIPIVCPGHTRPLAELQFCSIQSKDNTDNDEPTTRTFLVSACHDKLPMLRDANTGDWIGTFAGHKGAVWSTKLDSTACLAATASGDFSCKVWDAITGAALFNFPHKHIVKSVDFSHDSRYLATGGHEGILRIFDLEKHEEEPVKIVQKENEVCVFFVVVCIIHCVPPFLRDGITSLANYNQLPMLHF